MTQGPGDQKLQQTTATTIANYGNKGSGWVIQDHSYPGASKEPMNPLWSRDYRFPSVWCTMIWMILIQIKPKERSKRQQQRRAKNNKNKLEHYLTSILSWSLGFPSSAKVVSKCYKFMVTDSLSVIQHKLHNYNYLPFSSDPSLPSNSPSGSDIWSTS